MNDNYIDLSKQLIQKERKNYVKYRAEAMHFSEGVIDSQLNSRDDGAYHGTRCSDCQCRSGSENYAPLIDAERVTK